MTGGERRDKIVDGDAHGISGEEDEWRMWREGRWGIGIGIGIGIGELGENEPEGLYTHHSLKRANRHCLRSAANG
jgi:hypothetical protein